MCVKFFNSYIFEIMDILVCFLPWILFSQKASKDCLMLQLLQLSVNDTELPQVSLFDSM